MKAFKTSELLSRKTAFYQRATRKHIDESKSNCTLLETLLQFRDGFHAEQIKTARSLVDKTGEDKSKSWASLKVEYLPAVVFGYRFSAEDDGRTVANAKDKKRFTNLMVLDWDRGEKAGNLKTSEDRAQLKAGLIKDPHVLAVFVSPGRGLKAITVTNATTPTEYKESFAAAQRYFNGKFKFKLDPSGKDVGRLCFICSDKSTYVADPTIKETIKHFSAVPGTNSNGEIVKGKAEDVGLSRWHRRATQEETTALIERLCSQQVDQGQRHNRLFSWIIDARALGMTQEAAMEAAAKWLSDNGRPPAKNELENFWRDADSGLQDGSKKPTLGIRADVDFGIERLFKIDGTAYDAQHADSLGVANEDGEPVIADDTFAWLDRLVKSDKGVYKTCAVNRNIFAQNHPDILGRFKHDVFTGKLHSTTPGEVAAPSGVTMACAIETASGHSMVVSPQLGEAEIDRLVDSGKVDFDSLVDMINQLPEWDGKQRLDTWLADYAHTGDSKYIRAISRRFVVSMIVRALRPGVKMDATLILEGRQGAKKSSLARALAGNDDWFTDSFRGSDLENLKKLRGKWIVEMPELAGDFLSFSKQEAVKAMITTPIDQYRPSYGARPIDVPRRCVFVGTTNNTKKHGYMRDQSGSRRYWPVEVCVKSESSRIDIDGFKKIREQLLAEALHAYNKGEKWWLNDAEESAQAAEVDQRQEPDVFADEVPNVIQRAIDTGELFIKNCDVFEALHLDTKDARNPYIARRIVPLFLKRGWESRLKRIDGKLYRGYEQPTGKQNSLLD